jgi:hypothetical protein
MGLTQKMRIDMDHKLNCYKGSGLGDDECHYCWVQTWAAMRDLGYEATDNGTWFKRTNNPKILVIYE